jgi:hypothetical protein
MKNHTHNFCGTCPSATSGATATVAVALAASSILALLAFSTAQLPQAFLAA